MSLEVDRRNLEATGLAPAGSGELAVADGFTLDEDAVAGPAVAAMARRNPYTGSPAMASFVRAPADGDSLLVAAVDAVRSLDLQEGDPAEWAADPRVQTTSCGETIVHLHQHVWNIPVFQSARLVRFGIDRDVVEVLGDQVPVRASDIDFSPSLDAPGAVLAAALHLAAPEGALGIKVSKRQPKILAALPLLAWPTLLRKRPFADPITAHLVLFFVRPNLRLAWYVPLRLPEQQRQYDLLVAANGEDAGAVLFCRDVVPTAMGVGMASRFNPVEEPLSLLAMPQPLSAYPPFRPLQLPAGNWIATDRTVGNNVTFPLAGQAVRGTVAQGRVSFVPAAGSSAELAVNAFFLCNYLHDFFYLLGFDEAAGNFQQANSSGTGSGMDELEVALFAIARGDANMETAIDGHNARLNLGKIRLPNGTQRHTALDADVVIHEVVHAITDRLVGGRVRRKPLVLGPPQAQALDEGTSDYFALTIQNYQRLRLGRPEVLVYGAWSSGNSSTGRRRASYAGFAAPFSSLGSPGFTDPHDAGMIWCAALLEMNRQLGAVLGSLERGHEAGWQIVVDGLRRIPVAQDGPSFLDGRNALLGALTGMLTRIPNLTTGPLFAAHQHAALEQGIRAAFARFGHGSQCSWPPAPSPVWWMTSIPDQGER